MPLVAGLLAQAVFEFSQDYYPDLPEFGSQLARFTRALLPEFEAAVRAGRSKQQSNLLIQPSQHKRELEDADGNNQIPSLLGTLAEEYLRVIQEEEYNLTKHSLPIVRRRENEPQALS